LAGASSSADSPAPSATAPVSGPPTGPSGVAPAANGPIYFTDGRVNRIDNGNVTRLADLDAVDMEWNRDGTAFLHVAGGPVGPIFVTTADGTSTMELAAGYHPAWSPDGETIAFQRDSEGSNPYESDIFLISADGAGERNLTASSSHREVLPAWSPDGSELLFVRWAVGAERTPGYEPDIVAVDIKSGVEQVIAQGRSAVASPDGSAVAVTQCPGLVIIDAASHAEQHRTDGSCIDFLAWSPDGRYLAYAKHDHVVVLDIANGQMRALPPYPEALSAMRVAWAPDGSEIASIVSVACSDCGPGSQRGALVSQAVGGDDPARWVADTPTGANLIWVAAGH
jgi:hypothetical protein